MAPFCNRQTQSGQMILEKIYIIQIWEYLSANPFSTPIKYFSGFFFGCLVG